MLFCEIYIEVCNEGFFLIRTLQVEYAGSWLKSGYELEEFSRGENRRTVICIKVTFYLK